MDIHILRDGKQTGPFSEETLQVLLKQGSILLNDLAWQPGMPEWLPLHAVLYPAAQSTFPPVDGSLYPIPTETAEIGASEAVAEEVSAVVATEKVPEPEPAIRPEPATPRQKAFLTFIGTPFKADLTKEQAALLVNDAMENPKNAGKLKRWDEERLRLFPDLFAEEIKARRENRAQHLLEACQTEGAEFFDGVTKAHAQVLVGYLDVRFPNWDQHDEAAKYDYFFPAISEKFPQLLTKAAKGRFKYAEGPRVAPELARRPVLVRARPARSFAGAIARGVIFGGLVLGLVIAAVKYGRGELQLPFDLPIAKEQAKPAAGSNGEKKAVTSSTGNSTSSGQPVPTVKSPVTAAATATPRPVSSVATPVPRSVSPSVAAAPTPNPVQPQESVASTTPANPGALPSTVSLFDTPPPPPAATPAPVTGTAAAPAAAPPPQLVMARINKPTLVALKFGTSTLRPGTSVQVMSVEGTSVKIKFGPDVVAVPASNVDLPESTTLAQ